MGIQAQAQQQLLLVVVAAVAAAVVVAAEVAPAVVEVVAVVAEVPWDQHTVNQPKIQTWTCTIPEALVRRTMTTVTDQQQAVTAQRTKGEVVTSVEG